MQEATESQVTPEMIIERLRRIEFRLFKQNSGGRYGKEESKAHTPDD